MTKAKLPLQNNGLHGSRRRLFGPTAGALLLFLSLLPSAFAFGNGGGYPFPAHATSPDSGVIFLSSALSILIVGAAGVVFERILFMKRMNVKVR